MADDTVIAVLGIVGIVAVAGLFLFAMMRSSSPSTGSIAIVDPEGNLLYRVGEDVPRRVIGKVPFVPE